MGRGGRESGSSGRSPSARCANRTRPNPWEGASPQPPSPIAQPCGALCVRRRRWRRRWPPLGAPSRHPRPRPRRWNRSRTPPPPPPRSYLGRSCQGILLLLLLLRILLLLLALVLLVNLHLFVELVRLLELVHLGEFFVLVGFFVCLVVVLGVGDVVERLRLALRVLLARVVLILLVGLLLLLARAVDCHGIVRGGVKTLVGFILIVRFVVRIVVLFL